MAYSEELAERHGRGRGIEGDADFGRWVDAGADFAESLPPK